MIFTFYIYEVLPKLFKFKYSFLQIKYIKLSFTKNSINNSNNNNNIKFLMIIFN